MYMKTRIAEVKTDWISNECMSSSYGYEEETLESLLERNPLGFLNFRDNTINLLQKSESDQILAQSQHYLCFILSEKGFSLKCKAIYHGKTIRDTKYYTIGRAKDLFTYAWQLYSLHSTVIDIENSIPRVFSNYKLNVVLSPYEHLSTGELYRWEEQKKKNIKQDCTSSIFDQQDNSRWNLPLSLKEISPWITACDVYAIPEYEDLNGICPIVIKAHLYPNQNILYDGTKVCVPHKGEDNYPNPPENLMHALKDIYSSGWESYPYLLIGITSSFTFVPLSDHTVSVTMMGVDILGPRWRQRDDSIARGIPIEESLLLAKQIYTLRKETQKITERIKSFQVGEDISKTRLRLTVDYPKHKK